MKKIIIVVIIFLTLLVNAQFSISVQPVYNYWLNVNQWGFAMIYAIEETSYSGFGFIVNGLYSFDKNLNIGIYSGYLPHSYFRISIFKKEKCAR